MHRRAHDGPTFMPAMVAITPSDHSNHSGTVLEETALILVFFITLRLILQSCRRLQLRPGFIAGQPGTLL
jgi:hypothetical protein